MQETWALWDGYPPVICYTHSIAWEETRKRAFETSIGFSYNRMGLQWVGPCEEPAESKLPSTAKASDDTASGFQLANAQAITTMVLTSREQEFRLQMKAILCWKPFTQQLFFST